MTNLFPDAPATGEPMETVTPDDAVRRFLALRRSSGKLTLTAPGPDEGALAEILKVAARVPDHRRVEPWRFITITGTAREAFGARLAEIAPQSEVARSRDVTAEASAGLPLRAPVVVAVVSSPDPSHQTPVWEQELSAGAVCYNLLIAAQAAGWGAVWLTDWISYDDDVNAALGLSEGERIAGYIYIGSTDVKAPERPRPDMAVKVTAWEG